VVVHLTRATTDDVAPGEAWLTPAERDVLGGLVFAKRAADWRLGRWVAKRAVAMALGEPNLDPAEVEVLPAPGGAPTVAVRAEGRWPTVTLSLSHSGDSGFAAAARGKLRLGCDVETVASRSWGFLADYLTGSEVAWVRRDEPGADLRANLVWSAKESALKALGQGLRLDTRSVEVTAGELAEGTLPSPWAGPWSPLEVRHTGGELFVGWWCHAWGSVWTVVADATLVRAG
jgi:4'-phosphopantetheinyl transferase